LPAAGTGAAHNLTIPDSIIGVIEPPTYETIEGMITRLEALDAGAEAPPATADDLGASPSPSQ
jgi:hypothetical protein